MHFLRHRYFLCASAAFLLALYGAMQATEALRWTAFALLLAIGIAALVLYLCHRRTARLTVLCLFCAVACLTAALYGIPDQRIASYMDRRTSVKLTVVDVIYQSDTFTSAVGRLSAVEGEPCRGKVQIVTYGQAEIAVGDVLEARATVERFTSDDVFDAVTYSASRGLRAQVTLHEYEKVGTENTVGVLFAKWRGRLSARISELVPGEAGHLLSAVLLGERDALSDSFRRDMQRIGTSHMLALSGLHVSVLLLGLERLLYRLRVNKNVRYALLLILVIGYVVLTGFSVSTLRAGLMLLIGILCYFFSFTADDSTTVLAYATVLICLIQPYSVMDVSLWLSVAATFGILLFNEHTAILPGLNERERAALREKRRLPRLLRPIYLSLCVTMSATVCTLPLTVLVFGEISLLTPIANLLFSGLIQVVIYLAVAVLAFGFIPFVPTVAGFFADLMIKAASALSSLRGVVLSATHPFVICVCLLLFLAVMSYLLGTESKRVKLRVPLCLLLSASLLIGGFTGIRALMHKNSLTVTYLTYESRGTDFLLLQERGYTTVIDCSNGSYTSASLAISALSAEGETEIDRYILTGYQSNTQSTVCRVLSSEIVRSISIPTPQNSTEAAVAEAIEQAAEQNGTELLFYGEQASFTFGRCMITLHPTYAYEKDLLAFSLYYGQKQILYLSEGALHYGTLDYLSRFAKLSDAVLLGSYGPSYEKELPLTAEEFTAAPILCGPTRRTPFTEADGCIAAEYHQIRLSKK